MIPIISNRRHALNIIETYNVERNACRFRDFFGESADILKPGAVGYAKRKGAFRITCTLPETERSICSVSLGDAIVRYG